MHGGRSERRLGTRRRTHTHVTAVFPANFSLHNVSQVFLPVQLWPQEEDQQQLQHEQAVAEAAASLALPCH